MNRMQRRAKAAGDNRAMHDPRQHTPITYARYLKPRNAKRKGVH